MAIFTYGRVSTAEQGAYNQRIEIDATGHVVNSGVLTSSVAKQAPHSIRSSSR